MLKPARYSTFDIRVRAVKSVQSGQSVVAVAKAFRTHRATVHRWVQRYREKRGARGLIRTPVSGRPRKLQELDRKETRRIILRPASKYGYETDFWTSTRLLQVIRKELRVKVCRQTLWHRLRQAGLTYQKPERRYFQASKKAREEWLQTEIPKIRSTVEKYNAILYFEDEANISLSPFLARTWAPKGKTPIQRVTGKRGGVAAISAISKNGRLIFRLLEKRINSDDIIDFLEQIRGGGNIYI